MVYESAFRRPITGVALLLLGLLAVGRNAAATSISLPVGVNNSVPDAYVAEIYGSQRTNGTDLITDGAVVGLNAQNTSIPTGTSAGLNVCLVPICEGGLERFGGFADVTTGTLGAYADSPTQSDQAQAEAQLFINLSFTGTGPVTLRMHVEGTISGLADMFDASRYVSGMTAQGYTIDPLTGLGILQGSLISAAGSICQGNAFGTCSQPGDSISEDISMVLNVDPQHSLYSFMAESTATALGEASADGVHTSAISIDLSPGVTLDQSNGFLTQSGEPNFGSTTPEPSTLGFSGLGLASLLFARRTILSARRSRNRG